ncbi:MAG: hypothetical protein Q4D26_12860 [Clostridia bacterium]|nr:hypothetical protein [Clostridia bacterium]
MDINVVISLDKVLSDKLDKLIYLFSSGSESAVHIENTSVQKSKDEEEVNMSDNSTLQEESDKYSRDDVIEALQKLAKKKGKSAAGELLTKYGASKVSELKEEDYNALIKDMEGMV